jgi:hypothetical protein
MAILVQEVQYLQGSILTMGDTPIVALPAPAAGYVNVVLSISHFMDYNGTPYAAGGDISYSSHPNEGQTIWFDDGLYQNTSDVMFPMKVNYPGYAPFATTLPLYASMNSNPTGAGSTIIAYIVYETKQLVPAP